MTVQSIAEALGNLKIQGLFIELLNGKVSIDLHHAQDMWQATYWDNVWQATDWGAPMRVRSGKTPEEAIVNVIQAVKASRGDWEEDDNPRIAQTLEEALGNLVIEWMIIDLTNGYRITLMPKHGQAGWRAEYQTLRTEFVAGGDTAEEAIRKVVQLALL